MTNLANAEKKLFLGFNWKMNPKTLSESVNLVDYYKNKVAKKSEVVIFPPSVFVSSLVEFAEDISFSHKIGCQDVSEFNEGAFTGQVSSKMIQDLGLEYCITGHSETRKYFNLSSEDVNLKNKALLESGIVPVYCIGYEEIDGVDSEIKIDYDDLNKQVVEGLKGLEELILINGLVVAYEPVWAIGTGKIATNEIIQKVLENLRENLIKKFGEEVSDRIKLLYGGSVKSDNFENIAENCPAVDGFLIGGSSLKETEIDKIIK